MATDPETATVALFGAGGKMGCRLTDMLDDRQAYEMRYVEPAEDGRERLRERGVTPTDPDAALAGADVVILAVPDELIGDVARDVVPDVDPGTLVMTLDPAAAYAGELPEREDVSYFVTHPCHPMLYDEDAVREDERDWFGGRGLAPQPILCALHDGDEADYARGEAIARDMYAPVTDAHRVSTEQMAVLEPALGEVLLGTALTMVREGMERAVETYDVPEAAARDYLFGHMRIEIGIVFGMTDFPFSDGALAAIEQGKSKMLADDWLRVLDPEEVRDSVADIAGADD